MRWIRFSAADTNGIVFGIHEGEKVIEVAGDPFKGYEKTLKTHKIADIKYEIPVIPPTFYCAGINYKTHVIEMAKKRGEEPKFAPEADIGYRANNALIAHNEPVIVPADATEKVQYEGEIVVVIGKKAKNLTRDDLPKVILGYTIGNDVSERTWQRGDRTIWRGKNTDTFKPMGPWIDTSPTLKDLDKMETVIRVNGKESDRFQTNAMLFGVEHFLLRMTKYCTLFPGDIVWMGTDGAPPNLNHKDVVDIEITGLGVLTNPFHFESAK